MRKQAPFNPREYFRLQGNRHVADALLEDIVWDSDLTPIALNHQLKQACLACLRIYAYEQGKHSWPTDHPTFCYVYDPKSLQSFLDARQDVLRDAGWPTQACDFISCIAHVSAPICTPIFDLIHEAYGNDCATSDNPWLQKNRDNIPPETLATQHNRAEASRKHFLTFIEDPKPRFKK